MQTSTVNAYLYQQYQDDLDLHAFINAYNDLTQGYVDWFNQVGLPIYTGLSGALLDWIGAGIYGFPRPVVGLALGAIYNKFAYNTQVYGSGQLVSESVSDDIYKRILTWKTYRGDGFYMTIPWLKRRLKRFLIGTNGIAPEIGETSEIGIKLNGNNMIEIVIDYPSDQASVDLLVKYIVAGILDLPFQYTITARSA